MEDLFLSPGQKATIDAFLSIYEPAQAYDPETCMLMDTETIITETEAQCDCETNRLADYLATAGYRVHFNHQDCLYGWILKKKH